MATLASRLRAMVEAVPADGAVTLPVRTLRAWLEDEAPAGENGRPALDVPDAGLTIAELAELTGRAPSTLRGWVGEGRFPGAFRLSGREWRIPRADLARVLGGQNNDGAAGTPDPDLTGGGDLGAWRRARRM